MATGKDLIEVAKQGDGDTYVFGGEVRLSDPNPDRYDCSEFVEWVCYQCGIKAPDGAFNQWKWAKRISVEAALLIPGALLFVGDGTGSGRDAITHVAFSRGNGTTWEARGSSWGVGSWSAKGRFDFAGLIPGVDYSNNEDEDELMSKADDILRVLLAYGEALTEIRGNLRKVAEKAGVEVVIDDTDIKAAVKAALREGTG